MKWAAHVPPLPQPRCAVPGTPGRDPITSRAEAKAGARLSSQGRSRSQEPEARARAATWAAGSRACQQHGPAVLIAVHDCRRSTSHQARHRLLIAVHDSPGRRPLPFGRQAVGGLGRRPWVGRRPCLRPSGRAHAGAAPAASGGVPPEYAKNIFAACKHHFCLTCKHHFSRTHGSGSTSARDNRRRAGS